MIYHNRTAGPDSSCPTLGKQSTSKRSEPTALDSYYISDKLFTLQHRSSQGEESRKWDVATVGF